MSYILEALKKSKEERQNEDVPHLHIVHGIPVYKPGVKKFSRTAMLLLGMAIGLLCVTAGGFFYLRVGENIENTVGKVGRIHLRQIEIRDEFFAQQGDTVVVKKAPFNSTVVSDQQVVRVTRTGSKQLISQGTVVDGVQDFNKYPEIQFRRELPENIQKDLPLFVFAGHTYADDPRQRMIIINNTILREGDRIDGDTQLLNIIWEGVVINYKGLLFKQRTH